VHVIVQLLQEQPAETGARALARAERNQADTNPVPALHRQTAAGHEAMNMRMILRVELRGAQCAAPP
jgi:hypothetical protein